MSKFARLVRSRVPRRLQLLGSPWGSYEIHYCSGKSNLSSLENGPRPKAEAREAQILTISRHFRELETKVSAEPPIVVIFDLRKNPRKVPVTPWKTVLDPSIVPQIKAETRGYNMRLRF